MANRKIKAELEIDGKDNSGPAFRSVATRMGQVERQIAQFNKQAKAFDKTANEFNKRFRDFDRTAGAVTKHHEAIARSSAMVAEAATRYLGPAALAAGVVYATKKSADFEESLVNIQKKAGATAEQMATMRSEINDLGHQMPTSLDEISKAFERGAAAGIPLDDLKEFASLSLKVADAWDDTAEDAANAFAGFHASMGLQFGKQMKDYASLINDLADSGISDEKDIKDFVDRFGASGVNFGMTPQEVAAYGSAMLNLKMPAEVAARAMNTLTNSLLAPENLSKKAKGAFDQIVGDPAKFAKLAGNEKVMFFLNRLHEMSTQKRASLLGGLLGQGFSDETMRLVAGLDEVKRNMDLAHRETVQASNSVDQVYAKRMEIFNSQLKVLQNNMNELAVRIGDYVLPGANHVLTGINGVMADNDARSRAVEGMSWSEQWAQRKQYLEQWRELNPDRRATEGLNDYTRDLARVGRGEIQDVADPLRALASQRRFYDAYMSHPEWSNANRKGSVRSDVEFPGGDHHYDPRHLPLSAVPLPGERPQNVGTQASRVARSIAQQYDLYHQGWQQMHDAQPSGPQGLRDPVQMQITRDTEGMVGGRILEVLDKLASLPVFSREPGFHPSKDELPLRVDNADLKQSAGEAGQVLADAAGDRMDARARNVGQQIGTTAAGYILEALANIVGMKSDAVARSNIQPVNADTGSTSDFARGNQPYRGPR